MFLQSRLKRSLRRQVGGLSLLMSVAAASGACGHLSRAVVPKHVHRSPSTPRDADVIIDEEYVGPLYLVATQGLRLPVGQHRVTIMREGYFPWDRLVEADRAPIELSIELVAIPE